MSRIPLLYLLPHAHTDLGYTHDPLIAWELHDHFLDRAIDLCEATADASEHERFYWTIEVYCSLEHWWQRRDAAARERLLALMRAGRIDLGRRYTNGTFLNGPLNIDWEVERAAAFCAEHGLPCRDAFQNDVNGMSIRYARALAGSGARGLVMGLNTTMGVSPLPRPGAFWWHLGEARRFLVWHGWIYNRIGRYVHLNELETGLEASWDQWCTRLPENYPFPFVMMSGTIGDNVGPFRCLPGQVAKFNARQCGLEVRLTTISRLLDMVSATPGLPEYEGDWNDAWTFGSGSMPQEVAAMRRAQRRLEVIGGTLPLARMADPGIADLADRAQHEVSIACEHTYCSHTSKEEHTLGDDGRRQWVQSQVSFLNADSFSALALRKTLIAIAARQTVGLPSALLVNPTAHALRFRLFWARRAAAHLATSDCLEHLTQMDREPTLDWVLSDPDCGIEEVLLPPRSISCLPLGEIEKLDLTESEEPAGGRICAGAFTVEVNRQGALGSVIVAGQVGDWMADGKTGSPSGLPVRENPAADTPFQYKSEAEKRDPSDSEWNPHLRLERRASGRLGRITRRTCRCWQELSVAWEDSPVRRIQYRVDPMLPDVLQVEAQVRLDDSSDAKALYLPFAFDLPGETPVRFHYDSCGDWVRALDGQLPGTGTSFYEAYRGVAMERGGRCVYLIAPDAPLWQFGGFTYGSPQARVDRSRPTAISWLYNNYWYTNFPSVVPSLYRVRYLIAFRSGGFDPREADRLYSHFYLPFLSHPVWPTDLTKAID